MDLKWIDMGGPRIWDMSFFHPKLRFVIGCIAHHDATTFLDSSEGRIEHLQGRNRQLEAARTSLFIDNHWYTLCFLDHIWYSLEHTGNARTYRVSLEHTRITPRTYQEATNDYTGSGLRVIPGYTRILAQGIVIGYAKTPLDCPQMPSRRKNDVDFFLGIEHALGSLNQDIRKIQRISARKKDGMLKAQGAEDNPRTTRGTPMLDHAGTWNAYTGTWNAYTGTWTRGSQKNLKSFLFFLMAVCFDFWRFVCAQLQWANTRSGSRTQMK